MKSLSPQATNGGVFDVVSYGADPTGAADSQAAFQAAADALVAWNGADKPATLLVPGGKYKLNSPFRIIGGNATISAYGAYIFAGVAGQDLFRDWTSQDSTYTLNGNGLQILGGIWDLKGHTWAQGVEGSSAFTLSNSSNILIRDVTVRNVRSYHALDANTCDGIMIDNLRMEGFKNSYEWKTDVRAATTVAGTLASSFQNTSVIDGITLATGDRILIKDQAAGAENGIYTVNASGAPTRATDMDGGTEANDAAVEVTLGTANAGRSFYQSTASVTIGSTAMVWASYYKLQCKLATTANLDLTGAETIDGTAVVTGDRILVKDQTTTSQNGIYAANTAGAWTRVTDADAAAELNGASVYVTNGTVNDGTYWKQTATIVTLGTDTVTWSTEFRVNRYFSEAIQLDDGPNDIPCKNVTAQNCYMGPATDSSGLLSFGKLMGSHTDSTNGLYSNIKVQGCTSVDSLSNAIQGYSWADATVSDNTILGSAERGIRMTFNASNVGPRLSVTGNMISDTVHHGIEIDGNTGSFGDINVSNNVITSGVMVNPGTGIRINVIDRVTVCNNSIKLTGSPSSQQGIYLLTINGGTVAGNGIYEAGTYGIQTSGVNRVSFTGNHIYACGRNGIYLTATSAKNIISGNSIVGAGRTTDVTYYGIGVSGSAGNVDNSIIGNKFNKFGSGNEALTPIGIEGTGPVDTFIEGNTFGGDWGGAGLGNYTWANNATVNLGDSEYIARATATTAVSTTITALTGLSLSNVPAGTWVVRAMIPAVTVGSPTAMTLTVSPASGPTTTSIRMNARAVRTGVAPGTADITAFNSAASLGALTAVATTFELEGSFISTNTGTISISMTRTGGTSVTTQIGAYLSLKRVA